MFSSQDTLGPNDMAFLRTQLEEVCAEKGYLVTSEDGQEAARNLINWYLFGIRDPEQLKAMIEPLGGSPQE